jgi:sulfite reductase beta subunit-like hemoprotein
MRTDAPQPQLKTAVEDFNEVEKNKLALVTKDGPTGNLFSDFRDLAAGDDVVEATEQLAKSHGIYLEYNRAKTGKEKDWMYMIRITIPGGGVFDAHRWKVIDEISRKYTTNPEGVPSIRLTTRQNIQFHWIKKRDLPTVVREIARSGFFALNGCGDNTRNIMGCPLSRFSTVVNSFDLALKYGKYFELPASGHIQVFEIDTSLKRFDGTSITEPRVESFDYAPNLLNRKFKIAFSAAHRNLNTGAIDYDNCTEVRTNDMGICPIVENGKLAAFQVYIGGGQGERNGKASMSALSVPVGIFTPDNLTKGLDAIVAVHQEWGDRKNRHWARLKYVVRAQGIPWYQDRLRERGATFTQPNVNHDPGPRLMHHGWAVQESDRKLAYGMFVEIGRVIDREGFKLQSFITELFEKFPKLEAGISANQDLIFTNIDPAAKNDFQAALDGFRAGKRKLTTLRTLSGACVGLPTCRLSYTDSEEFGPELFTQLEDMGYGDVAESIGITGCERQCFRPGTKSIGLVGQGPDMYMVKLGGSEDGRHQGIPIAVDGKLYLRQVPRDQVAILCGVLFDFHKANAKPGEDLGAYHRRIGLPAVLEHIKTNPKTAQLCVKTAPAPYIPQGEIA